MKMKRMQAQSGKTPMKIEISYEYILYIYIWKKT